MKPHVKAKVEEKLLKELTNILQILRLKTEKGATIIVEGNNDITSLRKIDVKGRMMKLKGSTSTFYDLIYSLRDEKEIIILTDFDKEGNLLANKLSDELNNLGIKTNISIRKKLKALMKREVKAIEELAGYFERLTEEMIKIKTSNKNKYDISHLNVNQIKNEEKIVNFRFKIER